MLWRKQLKGKDFAEALVGKISKGIYGDWSGIASTIQKAAKEFGSAVKLEVPESYAPFVIAAAVVADLQTIRNLRGQHDYMMLRKHVFDVFVQAVEIDTVQELFSAYEEEFYEAIERGENPITYGIASVLYYLIKIPHSKHENGGEFQSPLVLGWLGELIMSHVGFSKVALENYRVKVE